MKKTAFKALGPSNQGFTLVELLIALFVFTLLSMFAYRSIGELSKSSQLIDGHVGSLAFLQQGLSLWEKDFHQLFLMNPRLLKNEELAATEGGQAIAFLVSSVSPGEENLQTVKYSLEEGGVYRERSIAGETVDRIMILDGISSGEMSMIKSEGSLVGVTLFLEHPFFGKVERFCYVGLFAHSQVGMPELGLTSGS